MDFEHSTPSVDQLWAILRNDARERGSNPDEFSREVGVKSVAGAVLASLGRNGEARILLPLPDHAVPQTINCDAALKITTSHFASGAYLDIACATDQLEPVFSDLVEAILKRVKAGTECLAAARITIGDFQELLRLVRMGDFSKKKVAGLIGELLTLDRLLAHSAHAWEAWTGPNGAQHDFKAGTQSLEVKATLRPANYSVTINGLPQLQVPADGSLFLVHVALEEAAGGSVSVYALGQRVLARVSDPEGTQELIKKAGCPFLESTLWNQWSFRVQGLTYYAVTDDFPRITPEMLGSGSVSAGVTAVRYNVDLSHATRLAVSETEQDEIELTFTKQL